MSVGGGQKRHGTTQVGRQELRHIADVIGITPRGRTPDELAAAYDKHNADVRAALAPPPELFTKDAA